MAQDDPKPNFTGLNSDLAARWQAGGPTPTATPGTPCDRRATGPCRHCLGEIAGGAPYLILAHRPLPNRSPMPRGPIFLCAAPGARYDGLAVPPLFLTWRATYGYGADHRIAYGSGQVIPPRAFGRPRSTCWVSPRSPICTSARPTKIVICAGSTRPRSAACRRLESDHALDMLVLRVCRAR